MLTPTTTAPGQHTRLWHDGPSVTLGMPTSSPSWQNEERSGVCAVTSSQRQRHAPTGLYISFSSVVPNTACLWMENRLLLGSQCEVGESDPEREESCHFPIPMLFFVPATKMGFHRKEEPERNSLVGYQSSPGWQKNCQERFTVPTAGISKGDVPSAWVPGSPSSLPSRVSHVRGLLLHVLLS